MDPALAALAGCGLPPGTLDLATDRAMAAGALAAWIGDGRIEVDQLGVALQLRLPEVMAASYGSSWWPIPPAPVPAPGGGWLHADLGAPGDTEAFSRCLAALGPDADAATVTAEAQAWRLPVCDYRPAHRADELFPWDAPTTATAPHAESHAAPRSRAAARPHIAPPNVAPRPRNAPTRAHPADHPGHTKSGPPLAGVTVCDLTTMWAGPLATWLLARLGARVVKVEPYSRPDGTRTLSGRGIHPEGREGSAPGSSSALFNALNSGKERADLDVNDPCGAAGLAELARTADVVIDSFSPRVMPQLNLDRQALTGSGAFPVTVSIPAFPPGPLRDWVAYGAGVHALSGLGTSGVAGAVSSPFRPPPVAYPDPLAGLEAAVLVLAGLVGKETGWEPGHLEASLARSIEPLVGRRSPAAPTQADTRGSDAVASTEVGRRLLAEARGTDAVVEVVDGAGTHLYPAGPFHGVYTAPGLTPAPAWSPERLSSTSAGPGSLGSARPADRP